MELTEHNWIVPDHTLFHEFVVEKVYAYYDQPLVFLVRRSHYTPRLGMLVEDGEICQKWIYTIIDTETVKLFEEGKINLLEALYSHQTKLAYRVTRTDDDWKTEVINVNELTDGELPEKGFLLEKDGKTMENFEYRFVIDTNEYSGNFERDMCAFCTGQIGECEVGESFAEDFKDEVGDKAIKDWLDENTYQKSDDNGCHRPCSIETTPFRFNNGMGKHFSSKERWPKGKYPAYESVAFFFYKKPPQNVIDVMKERAMLWEQSSHGNKYNVTILGFRLITEKVIKEIAEESV